MNEIYSHKILISLTSVIIATSVILLKPSYFQTTVTIEIKKVSSLNNLKQKKNIFTNHEIKDLFLTSPTLNYLNTNKQLPFSSSLSITKNKLFFVIDGSDKTMNSIFFEKSLSKLRSFFSLKYKDSIENFQTIREDLVLNLKDLERVKNKLLQRGIEVSARRPIVH